jgi:hypothetical protein
MGIGGGEGSELALLLCGWIAEEAEVGAGLRCGADDGESPLSSSVSIPSLTRTAIYRTM